MVHSNGRPDHVYSTLCDTFTYGFPNDPTACRASHVRDSLGEVSEIVYPRKSYGKPSRNMQVSREVVLSMQALENVYLTDFPCYGLDGQKAKVVSV